MTPPEKPQGHEKPHGQQTSQGQEAAEDERNHSQGGAESGSTLTQAVDGGAADRSSTGSAGGGGSGASAAEAGESGSSRSAGDSGGSTQAGSVQADSVQAGEASAGGASPDGAEAPPPWQRVTSSPDGSAGSKSAQPETGSSSTAGSVLASGTSPGAGATAEPSASGPAGGDGVSPDAEQTQSIPHPLQGTSLGAERASGDGDEAGGRRTVSFAGGAGMLGASSAGTQSGARRTSRGPRRASLQVRRVDPWSVLKLALVLSVTLFFVWMIAVAVLYGVLGGMGVWDQINGTFSELTQPDNSLGEPLISPGRVFGVAMIIGAVDIVLMTALATVAAFIYNVAADFVGGAELTLSERE